MLESETVEAGMSHPSKIEVIMETDLLKRQKIAREDGLPMSFFRDAGEDLTSELTKLLGSTWGWCELRSAPICKKGDSSL